MCRAVHIPVYTVRAISCFSGETSLGSRKTLSCWLSSQTYDRPYQSGFSPQIGYRLLLLEKLPYKLSVFSAEVLTNQPTHSTNSRHRSLFAGCTSMSFPRVLSYGTQSINHLKSPIPSHSILSAMQDELSEGQSINQSIPYKPSDVILDPTLLQYIRSISMIPSRPEVRLVWRGRRGVYLCGMLRHVV